MFFRLFLVLTIIISILSDRTNGLIVTSDEDLLNFIRTDSIVVLFSKKDNCEECDRLETALDSITNELQLLQTPTKAIKVVNSNLVRLYSPTKEPALVFFRKGSPMLLDHDSLDSDAILMKITENEEPVVKELTDTTFEHLTQASTGSTTGDWLVYFYNQKCVECQRLNAMWEGVGANLKLRMNTARLNVDNGGVKTGKRFGIEKVPEFILIRTGKFYRYPFKKFDIKAFVSFATQGFKNTKPEIIKVAPSPFDDIVTRTVKQLKTFVELTNQFKQEYPYTFLAGIGFIVTCLVLLTLKRRSQKQQVKDKRRKDKAK